MRTHERVDELLAVAPDAMIAVTGGRIIAANERAAALFGYPLAELAGSPVDQLLPYPPGLHPREPGDPGDADGPGPEAHLIAIEGRRRDGRRVPVEVALTAAGDGWLASVRPGAGHRDQRMDSLRRLAGGVAHDVNNLLGVVLNYAAFIAEAAAGSAGAAMGTAEAGTVRGDAEQIIRAAERATALSRRLLGFAGREQAQAVAVDLGAVVRDAEPALRAALGEVGLEVSLAADLRPVTGDPAQLGRVLADLVDNARDAMPDGGTVTVTTEAGPDGTVGLTVRDTGTGMPADVLDRAVEPFFTTRTGRPGLGLSAAYGLVTRFGAELVLDSQPGRGTTVQIVFRDHPTG